MAEQKGIPKGVEITDSITKHIDKNYLSSLDLMGQGVIELTIDRVEEHGTLKFNNGKEQQNALLIYFKETKKPLLLKKNHINAIAARVESAKVADWIGRKIPFCTKIVLVKGKPTPAVRVAE